MAFAMRPSSRRTVPLTPTAREVVNFQQYHFTIDPTLANSTTALISAQKIKLGDESGPPSAITVRGIHSSPAIQVDDTFVLIQANSMTGTGVGQTSTGIAQQGISQMYDVRIDVDPSNSRVTATIIGMNPHQ